MYDNIIDILLQNILNFVFDNSFLCHNIACIIVKNPTILLTYINFFHITQILVIIITNDIILNLYNINNDMCTKIIIINFFQKIDYHIVNMINTLIT